MSGSGGAQLFVMQLCLLVELVLDPQGLACKPHHHRFLLQGLPLINPHDKLISAFGDMKRDDALAACA